MNSLEAYKVRQIIRYVQGLTALDPKDKEHIVKLLDDLFYY